MTLAEEPRREAVRHPTRSRPVYDPQRVESGIRPVCEALNDIPGVATIYSCHGHRGSNPFVMFYAPLETAHRVHVGLERAWMAEQLAHQWLMTADLYAYPDLRFQITPNRRSDRLWYPWISRRRWMRELWRLAAVIRNIALTPDGVAHVA